MLAVGPRTGGTLRSAWTTSRVVGALAVNRTIRITTVFPLVDAGLIRPVRSHRVVRRFSSVWADRFRASEVPRFSRRRHAWGTVIHRRKKCAISAGRMLMLELQRRWRGMLFM